MTLNSCDPGTVVLRANLVILTSCCSVRGYFDLLREKAQPLKSAFYVSPVLLSRSRVFNCRYEPRGPAAIYSCSDPSCPQTPFRNI